MVKLDMIIINNLQKKFGDLTVLRDVTTTINKGDVISIIGPSGTGKSTFLRAINLLDPPSGGEVFIYGDNILAKNANVPLLRQKMGMVFQSFNLFDHLSILENVTIGQLKLLKRSKEDAEKRAMELLRMVGLGEKANSYPSQLSGGQKQRVAIARCLSVDPEIILFDEPTSALDPTMVSEVLGVIRKLAQEGMTMLIVTHEMSFAKDVSTRIFYMDEGVIYEEGSPDEIFNAPKREKTRCFINRIKALEYTIESANYDWYEFTGKIYNFTQKHFITEEQSNKLVLIIEEFLQLSGVANKLNFYIEYSEKTKVIICKIEQANRTSLLFERKDDISVMLINGLAEELKESVDEDKYLLKFIIRNS